MMDAIQKVLAQETQQILPYLNKLPLSTFYLAGGTALALQLQHRISCDFDFFSKETSLQLGDREAIKEAILPWNFSFEIESDKDKTLIFKLNDIRVSFFYYPYDLIEPLTQKTFSKFSLASLMDIGAMKFSAIIGRGTRRDFIDLYEIAQHIPLKELLKKSALKYARVSDFPFQALKSLVYFEEAEIEPMPRLLKPYQWKEIRKFFEEQVKNLSRDWIS